MRRSLVVLCLLAFMTQTNAQEFDVPTLRGTSPFIPAAPTYTRWAGFYFGGQVGHSSSEMNFAGATESLVAHILRNTALENSERPSEWTVLGKANPSGRSYGLFAGYNVQFSDVIFGVDLHYNRSGFSANAPVTPIGRSVVVNGVEYNVDISGSASMRITDYGAARLRAGWVVNNFLPYGTVGLAVGRANIARSATLSGTQSVVCTAPNDPPGCGIPSAFGDSISEVKNAAFIYGWSAGGGMDVMLMPNFFVRGEFEYIWFTKVQGIQAQIGTARVGAAWKF
jgi:outer membrane immunogenic protein